MNRSEIDEILNGVNDEVLQAHEEIIALQKGGGSLIKIGQDHLDHFLIGGLNNKMVFIGSRPSMGKTFHCETTINNLLNPSINPDQEIAILRLNLEMQTRNLLLRDLKKSLNKKMTDILTIPYNEEEREVVKTVVKRHRDKRVTNFSKLVKGDDMRYLLRKFTEKINNQDEEKGTTTQKIVLVDHLHIYSSKAEIDEILSIFNEFKMADSSMTFLIYFQFNRTLEDVWRDSKEKKANPKNFLPNSSHIYLTDVLMQYADLVMGMVIPQVVDLDEFASVYKDRNMHLKDHFSPTDNVDNTTARLFGRNRIYYNYIKIRLVDDFEDPRLYCDVLNPEFEKTAIKMFEENKNILSSSPIISQMPVFDQTNFNTNTDALEKAKGGEFEGSPF